jgi:hypothetical protein
MGEFDSNHCIYCLKCYVIYSKIIEITPESRPFDGEFVRETAEATLYHGAAHIGGDGRRDTVIADSRKGHRKRCGPRHAAEVNQERFWGESSHRITGIQGDGVGALVEAAANTDASRDDDTTFDHLRGGWSLRRHDWTGRVPRLDVEEILPKTLLRPSQANEQ